MKKLYMVGLLALSGIVLSCQNEKIKPLSLVDYLNSKGYDAQLITGQNMIIKNATLSNKEHLVTDLKNFYSLKGYYLVEQQAPKGGESLRAEVIDCFPLGLQNYPTTGVVCQMYICFQMGGSAIFDTTCVSFQL